MILVVMGVAGCGKTTVARALAERLKGHFFDADDYHPAANVAKMSRGEPLNDEDRTPWLATLADLLRSRSGAQESTFLACSALRQRYRNQLTEGLTVRFVYLHGTRDQLLARIEARRDHFMKPAMLDGQLATLEVPETGSGSTTIAVDIGLPLSAQVDAVQAWLAMTSR
jgi:carbohydrate kinase (thermoresistant glucokinase family)